MGRLIHQRPPIAPRLVLEFPKPWAGLNGACFIAPNVLLAAGMAELIWRVDLTDEGDASARIWLQHDSMKNRPGEMKPEQPGANGVQFDATSGYVYYTTTAQQMMLRVKINPMTQEIADLPEFVAGGREWDDFLIDAKGGVAYATTHRENTIDRVRLAHDGNREGRTIIAGDPFTESFFRWIHASHPHSANAHPHSDCTGTISVVHNGIMFINNPGNIVQALDARTGELIWENRIGPDSTVLYAHLGGQPALNAYSSLFR